ncbi:hypothetical protein HY624_02185 [Candidatus Uhrbacteria bacterium]|nr:hypothetical protein [Candidatus Uhrbacteria bacterium]
MSQCTQCQRELLVAADEAAKLSQNDRRTRKWFRAYQLLAAAGRVPTVSQLRTAGRRNKKTRARWRKSALVRLMMDIVDLVDALDEERQLPGEQGGIFAPARSSGAAVEDVQGTHGLTNEPLTPDGAVSSDGTPAEGQTGYAEAIEDPAVSTAEDQVLAAHRAVAAQHGAGGEDPARVQAEEERGEAAQCCGNGCVSCVSEEALQGNLQGSGGEAGVPVQGVNTAVEGSAHDSDEGGDPCSWSTSGSGRL